MKFTARNNRKDVFPTGDHVAKIVSIADCLAKASDEYEDRTPQLEVVFESDKGKIKQWYNLKGYMKDEDGEYIIKKGKRVEDPEATKAAIAIFERLAIHAGLEDGEEFETEDLLDCEVGIHVQKEPATDGKEYSRVKYTKFPSDVEAATVAADDKDDELAD